LPAMWGCLLLLTWLTLALWRLKLCRPTSAIPHASTDTVLAARNHCQVTKSCSSLNPCLCRNHSRADTAGKRPAGLTGRNAATALLEGCPVPAVACGTVAKAVGTRCVASSAACHSVRTACWLASLCQSWILGCNSIILLPHKQCHRARTGLQALSG